MRSLSLALCLSFIVAMSAFAQGDRGTITGTVMDPGGAVIANAPVEARNTANGALHPTATTATGNYTIPELPFGTYEITITVPGFKKFIRQNILVEVAQTLRIDATLEVGSASEAITVQAEVSLLKTDSADISHNVTVKTLNELPMMGIGSAASGSSGIRNPNNVTGLVPGTYYVPNSQVKINGAPTNSQAYHVEGMDSTNQGFPYAAAQVQPSVDSIQEISLQTSNFAPEFGAAAGGFFNVTMRSGTNSYHGSLYDYMVNEVLNAGTPFTGPPFTNTPAGELVRPRARRHDYGWTVGGPVSIPKIYNGHDRTFFFFNFEQFRETQVINNIPITVPTMAYRSGDFRGAIAALGNKNLGTDPAGRPEIANTIYDPTTAHVVNGITITDPFNLNMIPQSMLDPVAMKLQSLIPAPNIGGSLNNYLPSYPSIRHTTIPAVKIDHSLSAKARLSFYWSFTHTDSQYSPTYGQSEGLPAPITATRGTFIHSHVERLNYDHTLTPTLLLHVGVGYQQNNFFDDAPELHYNAEQSLGLKGATINRNFPVFSGFCPPAGIGGVACTAAGGMYNMGPSAGQTHTFYEKPAANASMTWVRGNHTYKVGAESYFVGVPSIPYTNTAGAYTFSANETALPNVVTPVGQSLVGGSLGFAYASFLLGAVDGFSIAAPSETRQGKSQWAVFLQDSWKVSRKLTLDYGVRWDYGTYFREQYGRGANFSPTTPNPAVGGHLGAFLFEGDGPGHCHCSFASNYPYAIGPRIGGAYQLTEKTVIRGGFGVIYNQTATTSLGIAAAGSAATATVSSPGQGQPSMFLKTGIPSDKIPSWPVIYSGVFPASPAGNQNLPAGIGFLDPSAGRPARQAQWSISIQREITRDFVAEASYLGNIGVWWQAAGLENINAITPAILAANNLNLSNPADITLLGSTLSSAVAAQRGFNKAPYPGFALSNTVAQSLRPFPQFGTINGIQPPLGKTWYDALQMKTTKRFSHGLVFSSSFTWQKSLQEGVDSNPILNNIVANPANAKSISSFDQPFTFVFAGGYTLPKLPGNKIVSWMLRDWQIGGLMQYSSGLPIPAPAATGTSVSNVLFQSTLANRVPGAPLYTHDINCKCYDPATTFILNPAAWTNPTVGTFSNSAEFYSDFRYARHPNENLGVGRTFRFKERFALNIRVDFSNIFNRTYLNNPSNSLASPQSVNAVTHLNSGGFGYINLATTGTQFGQPRNGTLVARFTF